MAAGPTAAAAALFRAHQEGDVPGVDGLAGGECPRGASPQLGEQRSQLVDDEVLRDLFVVDAERGQEVLLVAEVAERSVPEVVEQASEPQGLFDQRLRRRAGLDLSQRGVHLAGQLAGQVHRAQTVGEAAVLRRGEHPPGALQLVDALEALHPGVVDDVRFRDLAGARERDAQVAVQRVGDEVDVVVGELHGVHPIAGLGRPQGSGARRRRGGRASPVRPLGHPSRPLWPRRDERLLVSRFDELLSADAAVLSRCAPASRPKRPASLRRDA